MGFYFRKSVKFGPMRLNFSKSGIGVSAGIKGARISTGPRGTYVHAGSNGFYYRQRIGGSNVRSQSQPIGSNTQNAKWENVNIPPEQNAYKIETADVSRLVEASSVELLNQINATATQTRFAPLAVLTTIVVSFLVFIIFPAVAAVIPAITNNKDLMAAIFVIAFVVSFIVFIVGLFLSWKIHKGDQLKRTTPLFYELEQDALNKFNAIQQACEALSRSARIWRIQTQQPTWDQKRNAGATSLITRHSVHVRHQLPPYIATNVDVWNITLNDLTLFFMPDYIFIRQAGKYGAVSYDSLRVSFALKRFVEEEGVPPDAQVIDYTWRYVNKKGGPDRRFSNNHQIPIVQYGFIQLESSSGMNIHLNVSNVEAARYFVDRLNGTISNSRGYKEWRSSSNTGNQTRENQRRPVFDEKKKSAYEILGVSVGASAEQVVAAYRQMAKMYHPDRLVNLAPEFIELAEERMKEINAAYEVLKR